MIRIGVYEETGKLIGHRVLPVEALRPGQLFYVHSFFKAEGINFQAVKNKRCIGLIFSVKLLIFSYL